MPVRVVFLVWWIISLSEAAHAFVCLVSPALLTVHCGPPTPRQWTSPISMAATGFGARIDDSEKSKAGGSAIGTKKKNLNQKLRSVSSHQRTGAGSKPLRQAALAFDRIRKTGGKDVCRDVYLRSPLDSPTTFWFVGKVASENTVSVLTSTDATTSATSTASTSTPIDEDNDDDDDGMFPHFVAACLSQKRIILEYSMQHLRPQNFGGPKFAPTLEIWLAPPDSEMDVAQNKVCLRPVRGSAADLPDTFTVDTVGYNPEIYVGDEVTQGGLRVEYDEQGRPTKPVFQVNEAM